MARKRKIRPLIEALEITDIAAEGKALGRYDDMVVFVPMTVPGDVVKVQVSKLHRRFMEGYVVEYIKKSPRRAEPFCRHYGVCGGCKWQNLPYEEQLRFKQKQVSDQLSRIGKVELPEINPIIGSEKTSFYRNKLEFTFCNRRWLTYEEMNSGADATGGALGFHITGMFDKILDIEECHLQPDPSNAIRTETARFARERGMSFYDMRANTGLLRNIVIRTASTGETMVIVIFAEDAPQARTELLTHLRERFPEITSLMYIVNPKLNDSYTDLDAVLFSGKDHIIEKMEGLSFRIGPKSFYQTNSAQAYELYKAVRDMAGLDGGETVYDLYTGTGTIANFVASRAAKVIGIEYVPEAIEDARINSQINGIDNTEFFAGDMKDVLNDDFIERHGRPDVIILDPPRAGIHEDVAATILRAAPDRIVYVSCNPATQARDIAILDHNYRIESIQPVDMFPHTHHVENIVLMKRR
ncbi:MAG: 23S rRNA (uracil(1939)-C(5))-methyltransferase RlmD [Rikenellaceae bacterium]|nr:23S rRNA (uracil(1939)-C(5))-methyltransferase RlmD [Rikenellaceae bacterium]